MFGEAAALSSAFLWALGAVVYAHLGQYVSPWALNFGKGVVAIALLGLTLLITGTFRAPLERFPFTLLLLSGVLGIALGDTIYFAALRILGARQALLLESLSPLMTAGLALLFLQETLSATVWLGMGLTLSGVVGVISERSPASSVSAKHRGWGITFGLLAALAQGGGAVLSRAALSETSISPLWSAFIRLLAAIAVLSTGGIVSQQMGGWVRTCVSKSVLLPLCLAAFGGTYLGIWLQQVSLKYVTAGVAQTLGATSPLFVLPMARLTGDRISVRAWLGAAIAVGGIALLFA